jgi:hypothetical protein
MTMIRIDPMLDNDSPFKLRELIPFIGAIVTGAIGGCVASLQHSRSRPETVAAFAAAYAMTGAFGGLIALAATMVFLPGWVQGWHHLFLLTGAAGIMTAAALAAGNISMRFILAKLGLEVIVNVRRSTNEPD